MMDFSGSSKEEDAGRIEASPALVHGRCDDRKLKQEQADDAERAASSVVGNFLTCEASKKYDHPNIPIPYQQWSPSFARP
jgi:hypothetical protein